MKYAVITPPAGLPLVREFNLGYHFVLSQYCDNFEYRTFYRNAHARGHFIMIDNGAAELGASVKLTQILKAADDIGADEIVLPDVLDDCDETLARTGEALDFIPIKKRAMCPQGSTWTEWLHCAKTMVDWGCATICIAKRYEKLPGGRRAALRLIMDHQWHNIHNIHLLGCYRNPLSEIAAAYDMLPSIRGIDTGAAVAYAQAGKLLTSSKHHSLSWSAPFDPDLARLNIKMYLNALGDE